MTRREMSARLIDPDAIRDRLAVAGLVPVHAHVGEPRRVGDGQSNLTYVLDVGDRRVIVRRPPPPPFHTSAHDVVREAEVVAALKDTAVPVPAVLAVLEGQDAPVVVTEFLDGDVIAAAMPERLASCSVALLCRRMAEALAAVHVVPTARLAGVLRGSRVPYLRRQLDLYRELTKGFDGPNGVLASEVESALRADVPSPNVDVLVHGDIRLGNLLWSPAPGEPRLGAVLDWELAGLGDPDADLAYLLMAHPDPIGPGNVISDMAGALVGRADCPARADLATWYAEAAGRVPRREWWFAAFVRWRAAVGLEFLRHRRERGEIPTNDWLESLDDGVPEMLRQAAHHLQEEQA